MHPLLYGYQVQHTHCLSLSLSYKVPAELSTQTRYISAEYMEHSHRFGSLTLKTRYIDVTRIHFVASDQVTATSTTEPQDAATACAPQSGQHQAQQLMVRHILSSLVRRHRRI